MLCKVIGWLRIVRPGSIIGPQQQYMQDMQVRTCVCVVSCVYMCVCERVCVFVRVYVYVYVSISVRMY